MLAEMTPRQFAEWKAIYRLNPWGPERDDLRSGLLACALQLLHEFEPTWTPESFLLFDPDGLRDAAGQRGGTINGWEDSELSAEKLRLLGHRWQAARPPHLRVYP